MAKCGKLDDQGIYVQAQAFVLDGGHHKLLVMEIILVMKI
jgi:hypothetical protein